MFENGVLSSIKQKSAGVNTTEGELLLSKADKTIKQNVKTLRADLVRKTPGRAHIGCVCMVKDEAEFIINTLSSCIGIADSIYIFDTGSTDSTVELLNKFADEHKIPMNIIQGEFVDFGTSRNVLLKFAYSFPVVDYLLLVDSNDILKNGHILRNVAEDALNKKDQEVWLVRQEWWSGKSNSYYNIRFIRNNTGWHFRDPIHEYITKTNTQADTPIKIDQKLNLFQDRTIDDDKSLNRFSRDIEIFKKLVIGVNSPTPRHVYYFAQTYACLGDMQNARRWYRVRAEMDGFYEEKYQAHLHDARISFDNLNDVDAAIKPLNKSLEIIHRAESLVYLARIYMKKGNWNMAYMYALEACKLEYPTHCILFVDKRMYSYTRYHILAIVSYHVEQFRVGYMAAKIALETGGNSPVDQNSLDLYIKKISNVSDLDNYQGNPFLMNVEIPVSTEDHRPNRPTGPKMTKRELKKCISLNYELPLNKNTNKKLTRGAFCAMYTDIIMKKHPNIHPPQLNRVVRGEWKKYISTR